MLPNDWERADVESSSAAPTNCPQPFLKASIKERRNAQFEISDTGCIHQVVSSTIDRPGKHFSAPAVFSQFCSLLHCIAPIKHFESFRYLMDWHGQGLTLDPSIRGRPGDERSRILLSTDSTCSALFCFVAFFQLLLVVVLLVH